MAVWEKVITTADKAEYKNDNLVFMQFYGKVWIRGVSSNRQIWNMPSTAFGPSYYYWSSYFTTNNNIGKTTWNQDYHPNIMMPWNCKLKSSQLLWNANSAQTYRYELFSGSPNLGSTLSTALSAHGTGMTQAAVADKYYFFEETYSDVAANSLGKGDIIIPQFSKTTSLNSTSTRYMEVTLTLEFERT